MNKEAHVQSEEVHVQKEEMDVRREELLELETTEATVLFGWWSERPCK